MDGENFFNGFVFYDHCFFDDHVGAKTHFKGHVVVLDGNGGFTGDIEASFGQLVGQAFLVDGFQEAGAEGFVDFYGAMDDVFADYFYGFHLLNREGAKDAKGFFVCFKGEHMYWGVRLSLQGQR